MCKKASRLLLVLCLYFNLFAVYGQSPVVNYSIKLSSVKEKRVQSAKPAVNSLITDVVPPDISYPTPKTYVINKTMVPLKPTNKGGAVPETYYGTVTPLSNGFGTVTGIAADRLGNVYVADWGMNQIKKIDAAGSVSLFAGNPFGGMGYRDGNGTNTLFNTPDALVTDADNNVYVSDQANHRIRKITPDGTVTTIAGDGTEGSADGISTNASFNNPRGLSIDVAGNIYVADQGNNKIRLLTPAGVVSTYAGTGAFGYQDGPRQTAVFNTPTAVDIDAAGNLYVSDATNNVIRKISVAGDVTTMATGLNFPRELRVDLTGNVYVADQYSGSIKRISPNGYTETITYNSNQFFGVIGLMLDGKGNLFAAANGSAIKVLVTGYTLNKVLPAGMSFDVRTGIISGTPTVLWPATDYTVAAYNGAGGSSTTVNIQVLETMPLQPSVITLPVQLPKLDANNNYDPGATSTNNETPIIYTSSNPAVATITADGLVHVISPGISIITANQAGNENYIAAVPVSQTLTVVEHLAVYLPPLAAKSVCDADFNANALAGNTIIPLTYTSSNPAVATIAADGTIHITGAGTTDITVYQNANPPLYESATPQTQQLTVTLPVLPVVNISAAYSSPCIGGTVVFTANVQNGGINPSYQWQVNNVNAGVNSPELSGYLFKNGDVVNCIVTNNAEPCVAKYPVKSNLMTVNFISPSTPTVQITASVNSVFASTLITFTAGTTDATGNVTYQWYVNGLPAGTNSAEFLNDNFIDGDVVTATITTDAPCSVLARSNSIAVNIVEKVIIPNAFTPNDDGVNDLWNITGVASYPNCLVQIFNRNGTQVYQSKGYSRPWNGTLNGKLLPIAVYYYVIELGFKNQKLSGYVTILR
jgi:gliding motility-associated-like protein